jgi:hypothetical protein
MYLSICLHSIYRLYLQSIDYYTYTYLLAKAVDLKAAKVKTYTYRERCTFYYSHVMYIDMYAYICI